MKPELQYRYQYQRCRWKRTLFEIVHHHCTQYTVVVDDDDFDSDAVVVVVTVRVDVAEALCDVLVAESVDTIAVVVPRQMGWNRSLCFGHQLCVSSR